VRVFFFAVSLGDVSRQVGSIVRPGRQKENPTSGGMVCYM
jgi:hypothetical protein